MADKEALQIEEQALFERERGLAEWEATLQEQENGVIQSERAFKKRNKTLLNLVSYVEEQEANLRRRAEAIGPEASLLVNERLSGGAEGGGTPNVGVGLDDQRSVMIERRRELLEVRTALVEEREALIASRYEAIDKAEGATADVEQRLLSREREISEALRELITSSASLQGDDDEDEDEDDDPAPADEGPAPEVEAAQDAASVRHNQHTSESDDIGREKLEVVGGDVASDAPKRAEGPGSRSEDAVTRRRKGRARARTNQFRITLEAQLADGEQNHFFTYRDDGPDDLPGIFIATPNLLKVGREVRVRIGLGDGQLEATGIVGWRRQRGESGGPPGMGVELLNLSEADRVLIASWIEQHPPVRI